jgi:ubiquinone/menaquinone biosynthesis C-methylase UbiE
MSMESVIASPSAPGITQPGSPLVDLSPDDHAIPSYLDVHYWWAYVHPNAVRVFERQWLASAILWGNYARLRDAALIDLGARLSGRTLQVACVYGDLTARLCRRVAAGGGQLDIVDVLAVQLNNLRRKLPADAPARMLKMDSSDLKLADATYDRAIMFFLLHEQPESYRKRTISELLRVVKPGGQIVIVDYARPRWWNPIRYVLSPVLAALEPFAHDLWRDDITAWMPKPWSDRPLDRASFFGGLYQKIVITR